MKTLLINQIKLDDYFLKENKDLLSDGFIWFYGIIKNSAMKEDQAKYQNSWFLFDKNKKFILQCDTKRKIVWINYDVWLFLKKLGTNQNRVIELCKHIFEYHFINPHVTDVWGSFESVGIENHFKNK